MKTLLFSAAAAASLIPAAAMAQSGAADDAGATRRLEPYVGVMGGVHNFDSETGEEGIPPAGYKGRMVEGVAGVNYNVAGPVVVGVEGTASKGVSGDIDWDYGAAGRFGVRAGDSGLIYGKVGYRWVNFDRFGNDSRDYHEMTYGAGFEVGPKDIGLGGITGNSGVRLRGEVSTFGSAHSFRPMLGLTTHF